MMVVDQLVVQHQALRNKLAETPTAVEMNDILAFMDQVQAASAYIEAPPQREQLQAILFHWNGYVHEQTGTFPGMKLFPYSPMSVERLQEQSTAKVTSTTPEVSFPYAPKLIWIVAILLILSSVLLIVWPMLGEDNAEELPTTAEPDPLAALTTVIASDGLALTPVLTATASLQTNNATPLPEVAAGEMTSVPLSSTAVSPPATPIIITYTVKTGDTLFNIARQHNTTVSAIMVQNGLTTEALQVGQVLALPTLPASAPVVTADNTAIVATAIPFTAVRPSEPHAEAVIHNQTSLYSGPTSNFSAITTLPRGSFLFAIGRTADATWYLVQLEDGFTRGWLPRDDIAFLSPTDPGNIPVVVTP